MLSDGKRLFMSIDLIIKAKLKNLAQDKYQKFAASLLPNIDNLIGVRIPILRKLLKEMSLTERREYLKIAPDQYFEELMLQALIIGNLTEIDEVLLNLKSFIVRIDNWSVNDSLCSELKIVKEHRELFWEFVQPYLFSTKCYQVRWALVILLNYFVSDDYIDKLLKIFAQIKVTSYYSQMALAWAIATCFIKYPDKSYIFLNSEQLDQETYYKSLQKIVESRQVSPAAKDKIKALRRSKVK